MATPTKSEGDDIKPGHHETEVCYEGEFELDKHQQDCKKNPGHVNFIPIKDFDYDHLPERYQDLDMMQVIQSLAALTVKLKVKCTSKERPPYASFYTGGFPFYKDGGGKSIRIGTGKIESAFIKKGNLTASEYVPLEICPCDICKTSSNPVDLWGEIKVVTAIHVVFDEEEAKKTEVIVDLADEKTPGATLKGTRVESCSVEGDRCEVICVTHDLEVVKKLQQVIDTFREQYRLVKIKYIYNHSAKKENLVIVVSHPHGKAKKISLGLVVKETNFKADLTFSRYTYTAPTCPGSSGAPVFVMGYNGIMMHTHAGANKDENFSGEAHSYF
ncbi:uncharacterized protein LOC131956465 [Physella acuta]|uniref:uncharacterized protein LOC131956465 n=1 Tax=Physella acuta TaxID=109671 RepID=UPI0027DB766A|nr:uncharacterized protein LOC131956465 [Physella acuta]